MELKCKCGRTAEPDEKWCFFCLEDINEARLEVMREKRMSEEGERELLGAGEEEQSG